MFLIPSSSVKLHTQTICKARCLGKPTPFKNHGLMVRALMALGKEILFSAFANLEGLVALDELRNVGLNGQLS